VQFRIDGRELAAIMAGGAAGALLRTWLGTHFANGADRWPWTIFAINLTGSFVLAWAATRLQERLPQSTYLRPLIGTGFCGAYTTFSTMQIEILAMAEAGRYGLAAGYGLAGIGCGLTAVWLGSALARRPRTLR
jgi:CrcB protein